MKTLTLLFLAATSAPALAEVILLDEPALIRMADEENPSKDRFQIAKEQSELANSQFQERYGPELFSTATYGKTNRLPVMQQAPTFSPSETFEVGIRKKLSYGVDTSLSFFSDQSSSADNTIVRSTSSGLKASVSVDIWKNLMGKIDSLQIKSLALQKQKAEIQFDVDRKSLEVGLRKIYWALVMNKEATAVTVEILGSSEKQLKESRKKMRESVGTTADVSRFAAQVSTQKATIAALKYQRATLILQLKQLLPNLNTAEVSLGKYDLTATLNQVLQCSALISSQSEVPWKYTRYDELVRLLEENYEAETLVTNRYDRANVNLFADGDYSGREKEYSGSLEEFQEKPRFGYRIGVALNVPVGNQKSSSARLQTALKSRQLSAEKGNLMAAAVARHNQMLPMISLLNDVYLTRKDSSADLQKAFKETSKMYEQARVPIDSVINDQNALLANRLEEFKTRKLILDELLDYLQIFSETPCSFNQLR